MPEEKVEKWRITKEMAEFSKNFKKIQQLSRVLQEGLAIQLGEADRTRMMLHRTEAMSQEMLKQTPANPIHEVEGQELDFDPRITY